MKHLLKAATLGLCLGICMFSAGWYFSEAEPAIEGKTSTSSPQGNPLERATWHKETLIGIVREVRQIDHYTYLHLEDTAHGALWVVVMNEEHHRGKQVEAQVFAHLDNFTSRKLNTHFPRLYFGLIDGPAPLVRLQRASHTILLGGML